MSVFLPHSPAPLPRRARFAAASALALTLLAALAGCRASLPATAESTPLSAHVPPPMHTPHTSVGQWVDLGAFRAPWLAGDAPVPVTGVQAPTRVAGLRHDNGRWLAIVLLQTAPQSAPCPRRDTLHLTALPGQDYCLRMRRSADFDHWLLQQHSVLHQWLQAQGWDVQPRAWVGYRLPAAGGTLEAHALLHPSLIEPSTRNNRDFMHGGLPGDIWARQLAQAARNAATGAPLVIPPLPFAAPAVWPGEAQTHTPAPAPTPDQPAPLPLAPQALPADTPAPKADRH